MKLREFLKRAVTIGTPECGLFGAVAGIALAALLLTIGFWKTLFIVLFALAGIFLCGVEDKGAFVKNAVNRIFPPKSQE